MNPKNMKIKKKHFLFAISIKNQPVFFYFLWGLMTISALSSTAAIEAIPKEIAGKENINTNNNTKSIKDTNTENTKEKTAPQSSTKTGDFETLSPVAPTESEPSPSDETAPELIINPNEGSLNPKIISITCKDNRGCKKIEAVYEVNQAESVRPPYKQTTQKTEKRTEKINEKEPTQTDFNPTLKMEISDNENTIIKLSLIAIDFHGNKTEKTILYRSDLSPPQIELLPKAGKYARIESITVTCDDDTRCEKIEVRAGNFSKSISISPSTSSQKTSHTINIYPPLTRSTEIEIDAYDTAGNKAKLKRKYSLGSFSNLWVGAIGTFSLARLAPAIPFGVGGFLAYSLPFESVPLIPSNVSSWQPWLQDLRIDLVYSYFPNKPAYLEFMGAWVGPAWFLSLNPEHELFSAVQVGVMFARVLKTPQSAQSLTFSFSGVLGYRWKGWILFPFGQLRFVWLGDTVAPLMGISLEAGLSYRF